MASNRSAAAKKAWVTRRRGGPVRAAARAEARNIAIGLARAYRKETLALSHGLRKSYSRGLLAAAPGLRSALKAGNVSKSEFLRRFKSVSR